MQTFTQYALATGFAIGCIWMLSRLILDGIRFVYKRGYRSGYRDGAASGWVNGLLGKQMLERLRRDVNGQFKTLKNK